MKPIKILMIALSFAVLTMSAVSARDVSHSARDVSPPSESKTKIEMKHDVISIAFITTEKVDFKNVILEPGTAITKPIQKVVDHSLFDRSKIAFTINRPIRYLESSGKYDYAIFKLPTNTYRLNYKQRTKPITYSS